MTSHSHDRWVLIATIAGSSMVFIDGFVVNLALPKLQAQFHASAEDVAWIVELYTLVLGSLMLLGGSLADRYGRRRLYLLGCSLFALGSIGCALAWSIPSMLVLRTAQAVGGMLMTPASLAILGDHFSGDARGRAIALWSAFGALTSTLGPLFGGVLIDSFGWRSVFWVNIPLAIVVLYATFAHIGESRDHYAAKGIDVLGALYAIVGLGLLTYSMLESLKLGWQHVRTGGAAILAAFMLAWFVIHEVRASNPLIPMRLFMQRTFGSINLATFFLYGALSGLMFEMPFVLIQARGFSALQAALATLPLGVSIVLLSRFGSKLATRFGLRIMLTIGPALVAIGMALIALLHHQQSYLLGFFPGLVFFGVGMGLTVAPLTTGVINAADPGHMGIASGISNTITRIAALLVVAAVIPILSVSYNAQLDRQLANLRITSAQQVEVDRERLRLGGAHFSEPELQRASNESFESAFAVIAGVCALLCALAACTNAVGIDEGQLRES